MINVKKRSIVIIIAFIIAIAAAGCGKNKDSGTDASTNSTASSGSQYTETQTTAETTGNPTVNATENEPGDNAGKNGSDMAPQLLQSASVDLDADGVNEEVEALLLETKDSGDNGSGELEGILKITDGNAVTNTTFVKKPAGLTGVMSSLEFSDLDGDGAKDIFLIIPESGASFSLNYFYAYSFKTDKSYSFTTDSTLLDFSNGFAFKYLGKGKLEIKNEKLSLTANLDVSNSPGLDKDEANNESYRNSWVEPTPVEISESSRISLVKSKEGTVEIKVPLPVFGRATSDMIGEIDLFYVMDNTFNPVMKHIEILDHSPEGHKSVGKWNIE